MACRGGGVVGCAAIGISLDVCPYNVKVFELKILTNYRQYEKLALQNLDSPQFQFRYHLKETRDETHEYSFV
jgi:hypothetical protein